MQLGDIIGWYSPQVDLLLGTCQGMAIDHIALITIARVHFARTIGLDTALVLFFEKMVALPIREPYVVYC